MEKIVFTRKAENIDELKSRTGQEHEKCSYVIEKTIELSPKTFHDFSNLLFTEWDFIRAHRATM